MKCQKTECQNQATKQIKLLISVHAHHTPAESTPFIYTCDEHAKSLTFDVLVDDNAFESLSNQFVMQGLQKPVRKFCKLKIENIDDENKSTKNEDRNRVQ